MPFTLFHLGPVTLFFSLIYVINSEKEYWVKNYPLFLSITVGSVIPDVQGFFHLFFDRNIPIHGISHTIIGAVGISIIYSLLLSLTLILGKTIFPTILLLNDENLNNYRILIMKLFIFCLIGIIIFHILPDITMHYDIEIFWPISDLKFISIYYNPDLNGYFLTDFDMLILVTRIFIGLGSLGLMIFLFTFLLKNYNKINKLSK